MKKLLLTALLTMLCILCAPAQQPGTKPYKEPRVRFGAGYRYSLGVAEKYKATYQSDSGTDKAVSPWGTPDNMRGGELRLEMTIRITPDWNVGAGWGMGMYDKDDWRSQLIYVKAERLYGKRPSRWFNYAELGTTFYQHQGAGLTSSIGGGYRLAMARRTRLDFTMGLEYLNIVNTNKTARFNRFGVTFGLAMHF